MKKGFKFHEDIFKTYSGKNKYYYRECNTINKALEQLLNTNNFNEENLTTLNDNIDTIRKCWREIFYGKEV